MNNTLWNVGYRNEKGSTLYILVSAVCHATAYAKGKATLPKDTTILSTGKKYNGPKLPRRDKSA